MMNLFVLLQAGGTPGGGMSTLIMMGLMFVVFYFFLIRPQSKKAKEAQNFISSIKVGDKVITLAGIHGKIVSINDEDKTFLIQIDGPTRMKIEKTAVNAELSKTLNVAPAEVK
jgi:preprotein translocase subunit YajC